MGCGSSGKIEVLHRARVVTKADISLDASVVLRLLVGEPASQYELATRFFREQLAAKNAVHVSDLVLAEAYFALQAFYQLPKSEAIKALSSFVSHSGVKVGPVAAKVLAMPNLASAKPGFVDRLIHGTSMENGHILATFEKAARKLPSTNVL